MDFIEHPETHNHFQVAERAVVTFYELFDGERIALCDECAIKHRNRGKDIKPIRKAKAGTECRFCGTESDQKVGVGDWMDRERARHIGLPV